MGGRDYPVMKLSVIIPVYNGGDGLRGCLEALVQSSRPPDEVIVVDDGSGDGSAGLASSLGAHVLSLPDGPRGPARARNRGAAAAHGDVLVFLDADVVVHADTLERLEQYFVEDPEVDALFGSYDSKPPAPGLVSRYKNLMHHYVHQHGQTEASTFWAGCGAIRRQIFLARNGFDESYTRPSIEDIELGWRLRQAGHRIRLCPELQVTHLKQWSFVGLLNTDIFNRAVCWTRLIMRHRHLPADLNLDLTGRLSALGAWAVVLCAFLACWYPAAWLGSLAAVAALVVLNYKFYGFFARHGSVGFTIGAVGLHFFYLLYSSLTFVSVIFFDGLAAIGWRKAKPARVDGNR